MFVASSVSELCPSLHFFTNGVVNKSRHQYVAILADVGLILKITYVMMIRPNKTNRPQKIKVNSAN